MWGMGALENIGDGGVGKYRAEIGGSCEVGGGGGATGGRVGGGEGEG